MAELKDRETDEDELALLLLLLFADDDMDFWLSGYKSTQWFENRLREIGVDSRVLTTAERARDNILQEIKLDVDRSQLDRNVTGLTDVYTHDLASRLAKHHRKWLDEQRRSDNERRWRERRGEEVPEAPEPKPTDIYSEADAKRESASAVTDTVSEVEITVSDEVHRQTGTKLTAIWKTEVDPCPVCEKLSNAPQEVWSLQFPKGPKAHPNCVLPETMIEPIHRQSIIAASRAVYRGAIAEITTVAGYSVRLTMNHPVLTPNGDVPVFKLKEGDSCWLNLWRDAESSAESLFARMASVYGSQAIAAEVASFHGDGLHLVSDIEVASSAVYPGENELPDHEAWLAHMKANPNRLLLSQIEKITCRPYSGYVYDFQSSGVPYYHANGITVHNCRCWLFWKRIIQG